MSQITHDLTPITNAVRADPGLDSLKKAIAVPLHKAAAGRFRGSRDQRMQSSRCK